ncbi:MAG: hypothetical protein DRJ01_03260 [Bacteroidetes bacterium]|nr:MAG: hypothetical protein DRJ01_03260 [Bacteroidota bacterium]
MKTFVRPFILTISLIVLSLFSFGQNNGNDYGPVCLDFQKNNCTYSENKYYQYNDASRSALFVKGQTSKMPLEIFNGRDYRISICNEEALGDTIEIKLIDEETEDVLYCNADNNYSKIFEFTVFESRTIFIEITVPGNTGIEKQIHGVLPKNRKTGCVGVLIEHMITPVKGF